MKKKPTRAQERTAGLVAENAQLCRELHAHRQARRAAQQVARACFELVLAEHELRHV